MKRELYRPYVAPPPYTIACTAPAMTPADGSLVFLRFCIVTPVILRCGAAQSGNSDRRRHAEES